jgi:hypothetical protein
MDRSRIAEQQSQGLVPALQVVRKWAKEIFAFVTLAVAAAVAGSFLLPEKYFSQAIIIPTNPLLTDKSRFFNQNIEQLYSIYGTGDDLDRLYAMATTDAMYSFLVDSFKLADPKPAETIRRKRIKKLKDNIDILKSANGELLIGVWTRDRMLSAALANAIVERIKQLNRIAIADFNKPGIDFLNHKIAAHASADSTRIAFDSAAEYKRQLDELSFAIASTPPPFVLTDKAIPALKPGKPNRWLIGISTLLASLLFSVLAVNLIERLRSKPNARQADFS